MNIIIENTHYELIIASDLIRDGLGIELSNKEENKFIAEIFRNDKLKKIEFTSTECDVPLKVIEILIKEFDKRIGRKFQE